MGSWLSLTCWCLWRKMECFVIIWNDTFNLIIFKAYVYSQKLIGWGNFGYKSLYCICMNNMITLQLHLHIQFLDATEIQTMSTIGCLMQIMSNNRNDQILLKWVQMVLICPYWIYISPFNFDKIWSFSHITKCHRKSCSLPSWSLP